MDAASLYQPQSGAVAAQPGAQSSPAENEMERLRKYIDMLPPEEQEAFMEAMFADYEGEMGEVDEQRAMAEELRGTPGAQGRGFGNVYTAANPLEHLSSGLDRYRGVREGQAAEQAAGGITDQRAAAQRRMAEALLRK